MMISFCLYSTVNISFSQPTVHFHSLSHGVPTILFVNIKCTALTQSVFLSFLYFNHE